LNKLSSSYSPPCPGICCSISPFANLSNSKFAAISSFLSHAIYACAAYNLLKPKFDNYINTPLLSLLQPATTAISPNATHYPTTHLHPTPTTPHTHRLPIHLATIQISRDAALLSIIKLYLHCRAMGMSVQVEPELVAMSSDHSESMPSSPGIEAVSSKLIKDWMQAIDFEILQMADH